MKRRVYGIGLATITAIISLGILMLKTDPAETSLLMKIAFFIAFFISLWGIAAFVIFGFKIGKNHNFSYETSFYNSLNRGFIFSVATIGIILLNKII